MSRNPVSNWERDFSGHSEGFGESQREGHWIVWSSKRKNSREGARWKLVEIKKIGPPVFSEVPYLFLLERCIPVKLPNHLIWAFRSDLPWMSSTAVAVASRWSWRWANMGDIRNSSTGFLERNTWSTNLTPFNGYEWSERCSLNLLKFFEKMVGVGKGRRKPDAHCFINHSFQSLGEKRKVFPHN